MSRRPARFTEAEARRLAKAAASVGKTIVFRDGELLMVSIEEAEREAKQREKQVELEQWDEVAF